MMRKNVTLMARATRDGILVVKKGHNTFYPKEHHELRRGPLSEDEIFLRMCFQGTRWMNERELRELHPDRIVEIEHLHKKALTIIVKLKEEIARSWTLAALSGFLRKNTRFPGTADRHLVMMSDFVIDDIQELRLDIDIPRPLLIERLLALKDYVYQPPKAKTHPPRSRPQRSY